MIILMFSLDEWIVSPEQACVWLIASVTATSFRYSQSEGITTLPKGSKPQPRKDLTLLCHFIHLNKHINMIINLYIYIYIYMCIYIYICILCLCIYIYVYINDMVFKSAAPTQHPHPEAELRTLPPQKKGLWAAPQYGDPPNPLNKVTLPTVDSWSTYCKP